jgi:hypothetical protein
MGRIIFQNPNDPEQPTSGVYRWHYQNKQGREITLYVGAAGARRSGSVCSPSTLRRGVSEVQRNRLSTSEKEALDTDFIVGSVIKYITKTKGHDCIWEHISSDPGTARTYCSNYRPVLQDAKGSILPKFRLGTQGARRWSNSQVLKAETELTRVLGEVQDLKE